MKYKLLLVGSMVALAAAGCNKAAQNYNNSAGTPYNGNSGAQTPNTQTNVQGNTGSDYFPGGGPGTTPGTATGETGGGGENANQPEVKEVDITASGFSPTSITIKKGDYIWFVNKDSASHWPASNPHPTHTDLPGFDALHALKTGEKYSYQFVKVGTWGYHDHLNPSVGGQVVVQP